LTRHVAETHEVRHTFRHRSKEPISSAGPIVSQSEIHAVHPPVPPVDEAHFVILWHWRHGGCVGFLPSYCLDFIFSYSLSAPYPFFAIFPCRDASLFLEFSVPTRNNFCEPFPSLHSDTTTAQPTISVPTRNHESNPLRMSREFDSYTFHPCLACFGFRLHEACHC